MHELQMGEIEQIIDQQLVITGQIQPVALGAPGGIVQPVEIRNLVRVGQRRIAHPDPDPVIALDHRIAFDPGFGRNGLLARDKDAGAGRIVGQPVIQAFDIVALELAVGQRHMAMTAPILQRRRRAVLAAIHHHRLVADHTAEQLLPVYFMVRGGDIPEIARKHF